MIEKPSSDIVSPTGSQTPSPTGSGAPSRSSSGSVQSVERAFSILRSLSSSPAGISELARRTDLPTSTVARLLATMDELGAVARAEGANEYRVGPFVEEIAGTVSPVQRLIAAARPPMEALVETVTEAVGLAVPAGYDMHYIDQLECPHPVQVRDWTGERIPMHVVSSGYVIMAQWPEEAIERYMVRDHEAYTKRTVTDPARMRSRIAKVAADGYCWTLEEFAENICSIAAPLFDASGAPVAALHIHGPGFRFPPEDIQGISDALLNSAALISRRLGYDWRR